MFSDGEELSEDVVPFEPREVRGAQAQAFLRSLRAPGPGAGNLHFLRSLRAPPGAGNLHFLRSLRSPGGGSHFIRALKSGSRHFLRSLRSPPGNNLHFLRSLRADTFPR